MPRIDLNIVDRGAKGTTWVAEGTALTANHLDEVMEQKTDSTSALNSLPTPFARFFVAKEAFRRVKEQNIDMNKEAGLAYSQIVSDILDVYELLFNLKYHRNNTWKSGEKLEIHEWGSKENLEYIKGKMPVLYNSLQEYYESDINEEKLYFVIYSENGKAKLLACSSPLTGFVTPPDMDKAVQTRAGVTSRMHIGEQYQDMHIRRKSGGEYFDGCKPFAERDTDFKNYMYNMLFGTGSADRRFKEIREFICGFQNDKDIRNDYTQATCAVMTDQHNELIINGLHIQTLDETDVSSYFTDNLIRIPYRISNETFTGITYKSDQPGRDYDYLLPFKPEVVKLFGGNRPDAYIKIHRSTVTVRLRYNGKEYERVYSTDPSGNQGRIRDLKEANICFDLGLFPNILSQKEQENNYFKVLVAGATEDPDASDFKIDHITLAFFKNGKMIEEATEDSGASFGIRPPMVRSRQNPEQKDCGTKFYELFNTSFDLIEIRINGYGTGLLFPVWRKSQPTETFTYAIDFGTSNTFLSRCRNGANGMPDLSRRPELFTMGSPMVSYMHEVSDQEQFSLPQRIEDSIFDKAKNRIKTEFLPAMIDGASYRFPIRTALCGIRNKVQTPKLFDTHNIAFFYETMMSCEDQEVHTDIKWDKSNKWGTGERERLLRIFIREILLIIKCDILQNNGDIGQTNLVWFSPLSFSGREKELYQDIWTSEAKDILTVSDKQIRQFSESEAPYYYYKKMDYIKDSDAVTVIDIGGGSTDFVYFKDNKPEYANSVHFGCDVLWENGFSEFANTRENGIYKHFESTLKFDNRKDLENLNESFKNVESAQTKDIINFWLSNDQHCGITKSLRNEFRPVFIYHFTAILYYMACMYKDSGLTAPHTVVFSGNGSKYIDSFISPDTDILKGIINMVFKHVFGGEHHVNLELPQERKESTCYGGLYRESTLPKVHNRTYQGDKTCDYQTVAEIDQNFSKLRLALIKRYGELASLYKDVLTMLKKEEVIDNSIDTNKYVEEAKKDMGTPLTTYYKSQIKEKYDADASYNDSIFFLPVINCVFGMTKL